MNAGFFHQCLFNFHEIFQASDPPGGMGYREGVMEVRHSRPPLRQIEMLWNHLAACRRIRSSARSGRTWFFREVSTIPFWMALTLMRVPGSRVVVLIHHNAQWAFTRKVERRALGYLQRSGVRFLFFEKVPGKALLDSGLTDAGCAAIPFPVSNQRREKTQATFTLGIFGRWGSERRTRDLVGTLLQVPGVERILVGTAQTENAHRDLAELNERVEIRNTSSPDVFHDSIASCRLLVFAYPREHYEYRASGLLNDAIRNRVPSVIPDYPILRHQIQWPESVGVLYSETEDLPTAVERALDDENRLSNNCTDHYHMRNPEAVAQALGKAWEDLL